MPKKFIVANLVSRTIVTIDESDPDLSDNRSIIGTAKETGPVSDTDLINRLIALFGPNVHYILTSPNDRLLLNLSNEISNRVPGSNNITTVVISAVPGSEDRFMRRVSRADLATIRTARGPDVTRGVLTPSDDILLDLAIQEGEIKDNRRRWEQDRATEKRPDEDRTRALGATKA